MPLSLKTMEVQIKGDQWNKRFRTVQVYCWFYEKTVLRSNSSECTLSKEKPSQSSGLRTEFDDEQSGPDEIKSLVKESKNIFHIQA